MTADNKELIGKYRMVLGTDQGWQRHFIEIKTISSEIVTGVVGIDLSIGPQARMPLPFEKLYTIGFEGKIKNNSELIFKVKLELATGTTVIYLFTLFYMPQIEQKPLLVGNTSIRINIKKSKKRLEGGRCGVYAIKEEDK